MKVNQAQFTVKSFTVQELMDMKTALNGEQSPINTKRVDKIVDSFIDGPLLQPLEVTEFGGVNFLTGGRHRITALAVEYADNKEFTIECLLYVVTDANDLIQRITSSNGSRSMNASEKKELSTASQFGFDVLSVESLVATLNDDTTYAQALDTLTLALALKFNETYECGKLTALTVARSVITANKKLKVQEITPAKLDTDGTQLTSAVTNTYELIKYVLTKGSEYIHEYLDTLCFMVDYIECTSFTIPAKLYLEAEATNLSMVPSGVLPNLDGSGIATMDVIITRPVAWQRNAAKWVKLISPAMKSYISESINVTLK